MTSRPFTGVLIHGVPCAIAGETDAYRVVRMDSGAVVSHAPRRFLAIALAAKVLHTPSLVRKPADKETPLSASEIEWGVEQGLIDTARVSAFAEGATP